MDGWVERASERKEQPLCGTFKGTPDLPLSPLSLIIFPPPSLLPSSVLPSFLHSVRPRLAATLQLRTTEDERLSLSLSASLGRKGRRPPNHVLTHAGPRCCCRGEGERAGRQRGERQPGERRGRSRNTLAKTRARCCRRGRPRRTDDVFNSTLSSPPLRSLLGFFAGRSAAVPSFRPLSAGGRRRRRRRRRRRESFRRCRLRRRLRINASGPSVRPSVRPRRHRRRQQHGSSAAHTLLGRSAGAGA